MTSLVALFTCIVLAYMHATTLARLRAARHAHLEDLTAAWRVDVERGHDNTTLLSALIVAIGQRHGVNACPGTARKTSSTYPLISIHGEVQPCFAAELSARVYGGAGVSERSDNGWTHFRHRDTPSSCAHEETQ